MAIPPIENNYYYFKYSGYSLSYHLLKINKNKKYIVLELSFGSDYLDFSISQTTNRANQTNLIINSKKEKGKAIVLINPENIKTDYICLNVFKKE